MSDKKEKLEQEKLVKDLIDAYILEKKGIITSDDYLPTIHENITASVLKNVNGYLEEQKKNIDENMFEKKELCDYLSHIVPLITKRNYTADLNAIAEKILNFANIVDEVNQFAPERKDVEYLTKTEQNDKLKRIRKEHSVQMLGALDTAWLKINKMMIIPQHLIEHINNLYLFSDADLERFSSSISNLEKLVGQLNGAKQKEVIRVLSRTKAQINAAQQINSFLAFFEMALQSVVEQVNQLYTVYREKVSKGIAL